MAAWKFSEYRFKKNKKTIIVLVLAALLLCLFGGVTAAYVWKNVSADNQLTARRFYFTVDLLGDTNPNDPLSRTIDLYGGNTKNFAFRVQNYFDSERISEVDAAYQVTVSSTVNATVNKVNGNDPKTVRSGLVAYVLAPGEDQDFNVAIPAGYADGSQVKVTIKAVAPYIKEMTLVINLHTAPARVGYYVEDSVGAPYAKLYVVTTAQLDAGKLVVDWSGYNSSGNALQIDLTNSYFIDETTYLHVSTNDPPTANGFLRTAKTTRAINAGGSIAVMFFKADPSQDYSLGDEESPVTAHENSGVFTVYIPKVN